MGTKFGVAFESELLSGGMGLGRVGRISTGLSARGGVGEIIEAAAVRARGSFVTRILERERPFGFKERAGVAAAFYEGSGDAFSLPEWDLMSGAKAPEFGGFSPYSSYGSINPADEPTVESAARVAANLAAAGINVPLSSPAVQAVNPHSVVPTAVSVMGSPMANPQRGLGGNVSPLVVGSVVAKQASETKPKVSEGIHSSTKLLSLVSAVRNEPSVSSADACVARPTGNPHGPGRWRGSWFNWCE